MFALVWLIMCFGGIQGLPPTLDISRLESREPGCNSTLSALQEGLFTGRFWAQKMQDASVKSPVGLLSGTYTQFGDFDECLSVDGPFTPQYCLVDVAPEVADHQSDVATWASFKWGVCVPASCSVPDLQDSLQIYMDLAAEERVRVSILPLLCTTPDTRYRSWDIVDSAFCLVMAALILVVSIATMFDIRNNPEFIDTTPPGSVWECLSMRRGYHNLYRPERTEVVNLTPIYGVHACSFFFVILGHRFGFHMMFMQLTNYRAVEQIFTGPKLLSMWTGHFDLTVDIFFFMSSFLLGFLYSLKLHEQHVSPFLVYLQRFIRLVPAYSAAILFAASVIQHLTDGPLWNLFISTEQSKCRSNWWANLLFIHNYVHTENLCMIHTWFISCEVQLFVVGTLLVLLIHKYPTPGKLTTVFLFLASTLAAFLGTYVYQRPAFMMFLKDFWSNPLKHDMFTSVYSQGHYRGTSYIVGLLTGIYVFKHRKQRFNKCYSYTLELCGVLCILLVCWSGSLFYDTSFYSPLTSALYAASFHSIFGLGLACIITAWTLGNATVLARLFSWRGFVPLSKLSYCVYLFHVMTLFIWIGSLRSPVYMNVLEMVSWTIADISITLIVSFFIHLVVENPSRYLLKYFISDCLTHVPSIENTLKRDDKPDPHLLASSMNIHTPSV